MKKLSLMALAAAGLLAVGCAEKDVVEQAANSDYNLVPGQNSWLAVGIALPDDGTTTRANEDLVDGEASEFEVKSAMLILFKGGTEANATYFGQYPLTVASGDFSKETGDNVPGGNLEGTDADGFGEITTTSKRYVTQITNPNLGSEDKLWAYVILNYSGNNTSIAYSGTFADFSKQKLTAIGINGEAAGQGVIGENGLVMTSVPIASAAGGTKAPAADTKVTTLSEVQSTAIFETKEEAENTNNPLTCCYVERAAVKVELKNSVTTLDGTSIPFEVTHWALGNVNNNASGYYNTRQFNADWLSYANNQAPANTKYRMVGRTAFFTTGHTPTGYRTYFGEDVNFDGNTGLIKTTLADDDYIAFSTGTGAKNVLYTYENTIDENSMIYQNTTYVGVKATVGDGSDFWVEEGQPTTKLDNAAAIGNRVKANASSTFDTAVGTIEAAITADLSAEAPATSAIKTAAGNNDIKRVSFDLDAEITPVSVTAATGEQTYTYKIVMKNIVAKDASNADLVLAADKQADMEEAVKELTNVASVLNVSRTNPTKFYKHTGGVSYYTMRIAHFGGNDVAGGDSGDKNFANGETPWSAPGLAYNDYAKIYPTNGQSLHDTPINYGTSRAAAWLGRWSIVRNNWYVLDIQQVKGLGSPVPVDYSGTGTGVGPTPDDNPGREYYIAAEIHILPWAKRYQSVKF